LLVAGYDERIHIPSGRQSLPRPIPWLR
jgi:hypothetical protein